LVACGILIWLLCVAIFLLSDRFAEQIPNIQRPLLLVLGLLTVMFGVYLWALRCVIRSSGAYGRWIIGFGILFRVTLLGSEPIQEVDIYRYIWDGNVAAQGVSPFAYTPQQVLDAHAEFAEGDLADLLALRDSSPAIERVLKRIHFRELPTIYPTVSQWVFRLAAMSTPDGANFETHVVVMKGWLVVFDLLTVVTMWLLLQRVGSSTNWILAYWWCPLLLKEFANSGHSDSIAVFLTVLAVYLAVGSFGAVGNSSTQDCRDRKSVV
jgi:hypothetical protein